MYKCVDCGNEDKFYGIAKERGNALIFQSNGENDPAVKELVSTMHDGDPFLPVPVEDKCGDNAVRNNLWAIDNSINNSEITWAYIVSEDCWRGFYEIRSCAICKSTNIVSL